MMDRDSNRIESGIEQASGAFFPDRAGLEIVGGRPHLVKVETPDSPGRVRQWPAETTRERAAFIASVRQTAFDAKIAAAPRPIATADRLVFERNGRFYEAQEWREGRPIMRGGEPLDMRDRAIHVPAQLPEESLPVLAATLAEWHLATAPLVEGKAPAAPMRSVLDAVFRQWNDDHALLRRHALEQTILQRWIRATEQVFPAVESALSSVNFLSEAPPVVAHFGVWPAHLLFNRIDGEQRLGTLLDPTSAAVSSPLIDIAQAITHGSGWTTAAAEIGLSAYGDVRRLTPDERRLLPAVAALDLVAESGRLFRIAFSQGASGDWQVAHFARAGGTAALISLETLIPAIRRATETGPLFKARPWVRRPHPSASGPRTPSTPRRPKKS